MPVYDYRATNTAKAADCCREAFEWIQPMSDAALEKCPTCGGPIMRLVSAPGFSTRGEKSKLSDKNLKKNGFKKLVNEGNGKFRNTLA